jgi:hypothetical protein
MDYQLTKDQDERPGLEARLRSLELEHRGHERNKEEAVANPTLDEEQTAAAIEAAEKAQATIDAAYEVARKRFDELAEPAPEAGSGDGEPTG